MKRLSSQSIPDTKKYGIIAVKQWGNTGLLYMDNAFDGLWSLNSIPSDNTESFSNVTSFYRAFYGCGSISDIPENLFINGYKIERVDYVFAEVFALKAIPEKLFSHCPNVTTIDYAFSNCLMLKEIPGKLFSANSNVTSAQGVFSYCTAIKRIPDGLFSSFSKTVTYRGVFQGCSSLNTIPENLFANSPLVEDFSFLFNGCSSLTSIPEKLFLNNLYVKSFESVLSTTSVESIPAQLFAKCQWASNFIRAFHKNPALKNVPTSIFDNNIYICYIIECFRECPNLEGESPFTIINGKKIHLYERQEVPDVFVRPQRYRLCFYDCGFSDVKDWGHWGEEQPWY